MIGILALLFIAATPVAVILFIAQRTKARKAALEAPWSNLASTYGGQFDGKQVLVDRGSWKMTLKMDVVSVMQAAGSPYYSDGGTFTVAALWFDPNSEKSIATGDTSFKPGQVMNKDALASAPALADLTAQAPVFLASKEAKVVFDGAVGDQRVETAFHGLEQLAQHVMTHGAIPVQHVDS